MTATSLKATTSKSLFIIALLPCLTTGCQLQSQPNIDHLSHTTSIHKQKSPQSKTNHKAMDINGYYARNLPLSSTDISNDTGIAHIDSINTNSQIRQVRVHVETIKDGKIGWIKTPRKKIQFQISSDATARQTTRNLQSRNSDSLTTPPPKCNYQGTAILMGQDALHGLIYTLPISSINISTSQATTRQTAATSQTTTNSDGLLFFRFKDDVLSIDSNNPQMLTSFCTGMTSIKGHYHKF
ncbi:hypothetical protein [Psychrobacter lutiphocae]|uniref:hypothetical protein n=1 Tax=Psychrobacter lutiphocae TaxID=540500 RepID=UPI00035DF5A9|nr:hypothetical protein [Psychrobacter lutiphocae]